jgi:hypothetical protein
MPPVGVTWLAFKIIGKKIKSLKNMKKLNSMQMLKNITGQIPPLGVKGPKTKWIRGQIILLICIVLATKGTAQFIVTDPVHTGVTSLIKLITDPSFKTMVKQIENLKKVAGAVRQFHRGTQIVSEVTECTQKLSKFSTAISKDGHISTAEYALIVQDVALIVKEGKNILKDMKTVVTSGSSVLKMSDGERAKWLDETYKRVNTYSNGIDRYFAFVQSRSTKRSGSSRDLFNTAKLYEVASTINPTTEIGTFDGTITGSTYDGSYDDSGKSVLDSFTTSNDAKILKKQQEDCERALLGFQDEVDVMDKRMDVKATALLIQQGWKFMPKKKSRSIFTSQSTQLGGNLSTAIDAAGNTSGNMNISGWSSGTITEDVEENIEGWVSPTGEKVANDLFFVTMHALSRELMVAEREVLRKKWGLDKCRNFGG